MTKKNQKCTRCNDSKVLFVNEEIQVKCLRFDVVARDFKDLLIQVKKEKKRAC